MNTDSISYKAMMFERPEAIPVALGFLGATWMRHREELDRLVARHAELFGEASGEQRDYDAVSGWDVEGKYTDAWGCVWENIRSGMWAMVTRHPVPTREDVRELKVPETDEGLYHGVVYNRLCDLRGFEELMMDFAEEAPELQILIDKVMEYVLRQLDRQLDAMEEQQVVYFGDDLGMQDRLPLSPEKWRKYLKPCYQRLFGRVREKGHFVYLHTDGHILPIIPDLIECGLNVLNVEAIPNGLDNLVRIAKGKICLEVYPDVQKFPFFRPEEFDPHIREIVEALYMPEGGLRLIAECLPDCPLENIEALCCALEKYRHWPVD